MNDDQMMRHLRSVGMECFVTHLALFSGAQSQGDAAADLQSRTGWTSAACRTRVSKAGALIAAGRVDAVLALIAVSGRMTEGTRAAARAAR